jgi:putative DNA primase/helicase
VSTASVTSITQKAPNVIVKEGLLTDRAARWVLDQGPLLFGRDGRFWSYRSGVWWASPRVEDPDEVDRRMAALLRDKFRTAHVANVRAYAKTLVGPIECEPVKDLISFRNGLYDWQAGVLRPHTPAIPSTVQLPVFWAPDAACPAFDKFLTEVLHPDDIQRVWELVGYLMMSGNPLQVAVMLTGTGGNGKGTFLRTMRALLGSDNCSSVALHALTNPNRRFDTAQLYGRLANIAGDIPATFIEDTSMLKAITGEDVISAEHKGKAHFEFTSWAVPVFSANKIPPAADTTVGWLRRWQVVDFPNPQEWVRGFEETIRTPAELAGVAVKGVAALRELMTRNAFLVTPSAKAAAEEFRRASNHIVEFIEECVTDLRGTDRADEHQPRTPLNKHYENWALGNRHRPLNTPNFYDRIEKEGFRALKRHGVPGFLGMELRCPVNHVTRHDDQGWR